MMKTTAITISLIVLIMLVSAGLAGAHCEIPCGIYGDALRFSLMREHLDTIEKSMDSIIKLSGEEEINYNQLIRWVTNKDDHVEEFYHIVTQYFMTQRVVPAEPGNGAEYETYTRKVALLHQMLYYGMKCKQTTDREHVQTLRKLVEEFEKLYFHKDGNHQETKHHHH